MSNYSSPDHLFVPLVGAYFRPPAKQVLGVLPGGAKLEFSPEPDNPYDPKAIRVFVQMLQVPEDQEEELNLALDGTGHELEDLKLAGRVWLGYIGDSDGKVVKALGTPGNREVGEMAQEVLGLDWTLGHGQLGFLPDGKPAVLIRREGIGGEQGEEQGEEQS